MSNPENLTEDPELLDHCDDAPLGLVGLEAEPTQTMPDYDHSEFEVPDDYEHVESLEEDDA